MKTINHSAKKLLMMTFVSLTFIGIGCQKNEPEPAKPTGNLTMYTDLPANTFDRLDLYINGVLAGSLTARTTVKPDCGITSSSWAFSKNLEPGTYQIDAKQYLKGQLVDDWADWKVTIVEGQCRRTALGY